MELKAVLAYAMKIGESMLVAGAGVSRVEDTVSRICLAYGAREANVFSITSSIITSITDGDGRVYTETKRIYSYETDFSKLDELNALSRYICANLPDGPYIESEIERIRNIEPIPFSRKVLASALIAGAFAYFFGGGIQESIVALICGALVIWFQGYIEKISANEMFVNFIASFFVSTIAYIFAKTGFAPDYGKVIIGNIMLLVPGVAVVNALRDMIGGDMMSGILKVCESVLLAIFLAGGSFAALVFWGGVL